MARSPEEEFSGIGRDQLIKMLLEEREERKRSDERWTQRLVVLETRLDRIMQIARGAL